MEEHFASPEIQKRVRDMQDHANAVLDTESKERALVGEVVSTVTLAGQISLRNLQGKGPELNIV